MRSLPTVAPEVHREFKDGKFTVHQTEGCFNGVWTDMALEKTYNRDAKTKLFTGISQQPWRILASSSMSDSGFRADKGYGTLAWTVAPRYRHPTSIQLPQKKANVHGAQSQGLPGRVLLSKTCTQKPAGLG